MTVFRAMDSEWEDLARSRRAVDSLRGWALADEHLVAFPHLEALRLYAHRRDHPRDSDRVLAALARRAASDDLAARTILQTLAPGLIRIACRFRPAGPSEDDVANAVVTAAFERIRTYPIARRPEKIAANILFDTRQAVSRSLCRPRVQEILSAETSDFGSSVCDEDPTGELIALVGEAVGRGHVDPDEARLILLTRVADVPVTRLASERGCLPHSIRRRRLRAEARLAAFAR